MGLTRQAVRRIFTLRRCWLPSQCRLRGGCSAVCQKPTRSFCQCPIRCWSSRTVAETREVRRLGQFLFLLLWLRFGFCCARAPRGNHRRRRRPECFLALCLHLIRSDSCCKSCMYDAYMKKRDFTSAEEAPVALGMGGGSCRLVVFRSLFVLSSNRRQSAWASARFSSKRRWFCSA